MTARHRDMDRRTFDEQSEHPRYDPIVIAVAACKHPNRDMNLGEAKAIAFAWRELRDAAEKNSRSDRNFDVIRKHLSEAVIELARVVDITTIEGYDKDLKPRTRDEFVTLIRIYASWILRQMFLILPDEVQP